MTHVSQTPAPAPVVDYICMYCGKVEQTNFLAMNGISIDGKTHYYLCDECNKEWETIRSANLFHLYNGYHAGRVEYKVYQDAFNRLMQNWLLGFPEKVILT